MNYVSRLQEALNRDYTLGALKIFIIVWAIFIIFLSLVIDNKWILAGIIAYEVLP